MLPVARLSDGAHVALAGRDARLCDDGGDWHPHFVTLFVTLSSRRPGMLGPEERPCLAQEGDER